MEPRDCQAESPKVVWLFGLSGAGKSTLADALARRLRDQGLRVTRLDGDDLRGGLCADLGFEPDARSENLRRAAHVAALMGDAGMVVVCSFITPFERDRARIREILGDRVAQVFVDTTLAECERRDPKGLYRRARGGELSGFTGISSPFEAPKSADLVLATEGTSVVESTETLGRRLGLFEPEYAI